jgi:nicotinamide-nucleotide amidase
MLDNQDFTVAILPSALSQFKLSADKYFIPFLEKKHDVKRKLITLKYLGNERKLLDTLRRAKEMSTKNFEYSIKEKFGDFKIDLSYDVKDGDYCPSIRYVIENLGEDIYAEYDVGLGERLFDLLKLKKLTLSVAESFTAGRVTSEIISKPGASEFFKEGIVCYSNESKMERLGVEKGKLISEGAVSSVVAYQMALGLLRTGVDVAISTTGIAGPKSDNSLKPVGLCYIAVGKKDGIHTYKLNLKGDREKITETAKNTAIFLAIKNLKKI